MTDSLLNGKTTISSLSVKDPLNEVAAVYKVRKKEEEDQQQQIGLFDEIDPRNVPGNLHLLSDSSLTNLMERQGAINVVRRLARDLANTEAELYVLRKSHEEKERILKKMLVECEVSLVDIDKRLLNEGKKTSGKKKLMLDDLLKDAIEDENQHPLAELEQTPKALKQNHLNRPQGNTTKSSNSWFGSFWNSASSSSNSSIISGDNQKDDIHLGRHYAVSSPTPPTFNLTKQTASNTEQNQKYKSLSLSAASALANPSNITDLPQKSIIKTKSATTTQTIVSDILPVELDQIYPLESQPPTLVPNNIYNYTYSDKDKINQHVLRDKYGFIYDRKIPKASPNTAKNIKSNNQAPTLSQVPPPSSNKPPSFVSSIFSNDEDLHLLNDYDRNHNNRSLSRSSLVHSDATHMHLLRSNNSNSTTIINSNRENQKSDPIVKLDPTTTYGNQISSSIISNGTFSNSFHVGSESSHSLDNIFTNDVDPIDIDLENENENENENEIHNDNDNTYYANETEIENQSFRNSTKSPTLSVNGYTAMKLLSHLAELHDTYQKEQKLKWDEFLLKLRKNHLNNNPAINKIDDNSNLVNKDDVENNENTNKFYNYIDSELLGRQANKIDNYKLFKKDFNKLVYNGIPMEYRRQLWFECSGSLSLKIPGYYDSLLLSDASNDNDNSAAESQIDLDLYRTMPYNVFFANNGPGIKKLRRVLIAFSKSNPKIGYCQGMNMISAVLLLTFITEEDAFWALKNLIESFLPNDYFNPPLLNLRADQLILQHHYLKRYLPNVYNKFIRLNINIEAITFNWFLTCFIDFLPIDSLFRLWDIFWCIENNESFLFKLSLSIFKCFENLILDRKVNDEGEIYMIFLKYTQNQRHSLKSKNRINNHNNERMNELDVDKILKYLKEFDSVVKMEDILELRKKEIEKLLG